MAEWRSPSATVIFNSTLSASLKRPRASAIPVSFGCRSGKLIVASPRIAANASRRPRSYLDRHARATRPSPNVVTPAGAGGRLRRRARGSSLE
jgi:hypothetical protein